MSFIIPDGFADEKCINTVKSVVNFIEQQVKKYQVDAIKYERYAETRACLEHLLAKPNMYSAFFVIRELNTLRHSIPVKSPIIIKKVHDYFNMQIGAYCLSERPCANQIKGYPYKSTNVVDLLDEIENVRSERFNSGLSRQKYNKQR